MKGLKQKLKRPTTNTPLPKDAAWTRQDQRVWQAVASNLPPKVAAKLGKHPDVDVNRICPNVGYSVVHYAAAKGLDDCLNILLAHKADASSCDITGATPLHAAARYGHKGTTTKLLASRSIKVNLSDNNKCTALHFAAFEGHVECVKLIANTSGIELNCTDKDGRTPLMVAAAMGRTDVCKELVGRECDLHHRDNTLGHTALTLAADSGHADVVRLLSDHGADHTKALHDGRTALDLAKQKDRRSVVDALHIVQLTEAANKSTNGPRLSTSSNKYIPEDAVLKKRHSYDGILETNQTYIDDLVAGTHLSTGSRTPKPTRRNKEDKKHSKSNMSRIKTAVGAKIKSSSRRGSDASGLSSTSTPRSKKKKDPVVASPDSNALSLYTEGNPNFYEKEIKFYDSNSSLDVSSTCSAMQNMSKSMDSLRPMPEEYDAASNGTSFSSSPAPKVEGTDFSKRQNNAEVIRLKKINTDHEKRIHELEEQLARANEVSVATEKLQKNAEEVRNAQLNAAKEEFERKEAKMVKDMEEIKQVKKQNDEYQKKCNAVQEESTELAKQLKQQEDASLKLRNENKILVDKVENLENENKNMKLAVGKGKENESTIIKQAKEKIIEAEQRCNQAESRAIDAEQKLSDAEMKINEKEQHSNSLESKIGELELICTEVEQKRNDIQTKCDELERVLGDVERLKTDAEKKMSDVTKEKRKLEKELKKLKEKSAGFETGLKSYETEFEGIASLFATAGLTANRTQDKNGVDITTLKRDIAELIEKIQEDEGQLNNTEAKKKDLEEQLNTSISEKDKKIDELQKQIKDIQDALTKKAADCSKLESELKHTKGQLLTLDAEKKKREKDFEDELNKNRAELKKFESAKVAQASEFSRSRDEVTELRQQLDEALNALEKHREDSVPRDAYEADCAKIRDDADVLKKEVAKTIEKFALVQMELANKEQEISDLRVERNQSEAKSTKYETEVSQLKTKCHETEVQVNILRQQLTETKHKLDKASEEVESLRKSRRDMTIRLSTKHGEINESEKKKIESLKKQVENLSSHVQDSEKKYRDTIAIYRGHLLAAVTGQLDSDVQQALQEILKLRGKEDEKAQVSHS